MTNELDLPDNWQDILVGGDGPLPARLFGLGQNPGIEEICHNPPLPFIGMAGRLLDVQFDCVGLSRPETYLSNAYKHYTIGDREPNQGELESHLEILMEEIRQCEPEVVATFGACPTRWLFKLAGVSYRDMETAHGIPVRISQPVWTTVVPVIHPAAGLYSSEAMNPTFYDLQVVKGLLDGDVVVREPVDQSGLVKEKITSLVQLQNVLLDGGDHSILSIDTESGKGWKWGLTFSFDGIHGYQIYASKEEILQAFAQWLIAATSAKVTTVLLHNSMWDLTVLESLGIHLPDGSYIDTMILAFLLCLEPQGLKPLAWRHLGLELRDYNDVVGPRDKEMALEYLSQALQTDWDKCPSCGAEGYDPWGKSIAGAKWHPRGGWAQVPVEWLKKSGGVRVKYGLEFGSRFSVCMGASDLKPLNKRIEKIMLAATKEDGDEEEKGEGWKEEAGEEAKANVAGNYSSPSQPRRDSGTTGAGADDDIPF